MSKKTEKALNEKLNAKLPENLSKENILEQLEKVQQNEKIVEIPKKKNTAKRLVPIAASLALVVGLLGIYFGAGLGDKLKREENIGDKTEVVRYQSYDKIYDKFDALREEYEENKKGNIFQDVFNFGNEAFSYTDVVVQDMAGDMEFGSANGSVLPESSEENRDDGSSVQNAITGNAPTTENKVHGTTNTQENGVDEGDIIKTDGNYLYIANADEKTVSIVDIADKEMKISSQIEVEKTNRVNELYISDNKLVVLGFCYDTESEKYKYSYDDGFVNYGGFNVSETFVKVFDITDRSSPKLVTEYTQQGNYDNSRMIGKKLYCVSTYYVNIADENYRDNCIPETEINGVCEKVPADCISVVEESNASIYAVITTLDIENSTEPSCEAILGNCDELYASAKGLFISENDYYSESYHAYQQTTKVYRFEYTDTGVNYKCMGRVAGYINDQFSMSYDGEYFRIATTVNKTVTYDENGEAIEVQLWDEDGWRNKELDDVAVSNVTMNNLYILNNNMQIVGKVEDLAEGETIQSVRFVGNMAYVVTFRQTDPLFVIDLSDPKNPTVKGELKIPGFSEYLHPIADGLLVGVGYDGTELGTNGDCKVSLFDVSNPYEPKETSVVRVTEGEGSVYNSVGINHKLFVRLSENEFAVPFNVRWFVHSGEKGRERGTYYIRYKLEDGEICELSRYYMCAEETGIMGATYAGNIFYAVVDCYNQGTCVISYDLTTNTEVDRVLLNEWE